MATVLIFVIGLFVLGIVLRIAMVIINVCMVPLRFVFRILKVIWNMVKFVVRTIWKAIKYIHAKYCIWFDRHYEYRDWPEMNII